MRLDLHIHTVASDGAWTAEQVVEGAVQGRLDVIAIADHDTAAAVGPAREAASGLNLQVVPAAELSSTYGARELHVLGYFIDPGAPALIDFQQRATALRQTRMEGMVARLCEAGVPIVMERVFEEAGPDRGVLARPHLARALVRIGRASSVSDAFDRLIGDRHAAFIPTRLQSPEEAIGVIRGAGGLAVWAHPPDDLLDQLVDPLAEAGLEGLEIYRPFAKPAFAARLQAHRRRLGLVASGGSDWHDPNRNDALGSFYVSSDEVAELLERGGI